MFVGSSGRACWSILDSIFLRLYTISLGLFGSVRTAVGLFFAWWRHAEWPALLLMTNYYLQMLFASTIYNLWLSFCLSFFCLFLEPLTFWDLLLLIWAISLSIILWVVRLFILRLLAFFASTYMVAWLFWGTGGLPPSQRLPLPPGPKPFFTFMLLFLGLWRSIRLTCFSCFGPVNSNGL